MTTKKTTTSTKPTRSNRTASQRIASLEDEIERIRQRDAAKQVRASADGKAFIAAVKATSKALDAAREAGNDSMVQALTTAHSALAEEAERMSLRVPAPKRRASNSTAA